MHWIFENARQRISFPRNKHDWVVPALPDPTDETIYMFAEALRCSVLCNRSKELNTVQDTVAVVTYLWLVHIHFQDYISFSLQTITQSADKPAICQDTESGEHCDMLLWK